METGRSRVRTPLLYQASIRLLRSLVGAILIAGLMAVWILHSTQEKAAWREIRQAAEHLSEVIRDRERRWAEAAVRYKSRLEFARLLEDPDDRWTKLRSYLSSQNNDEFFPTLLMTDRDGRVLYASGLARESTPQVFLPSPDIGWHFDQRTDTLYRYYVQPMWLGAGGMGHIVLMRPIDHPLLGQLSGFNTHLFLRWQGRGIASSLAEPIPPGHLLPSPGLLEDEGVTYMQDNFPWDSRDPEGPELVVHRQMVSLFSYWEIALGVAVALAALFSAQWISMGLWVYRTTRRITLVGEASRRFTEEGDASPGIKAILDEAGAPREDEINEVAHSIESLTATVAQRNAERDAYEKALEESEEKFRLISTFAVDAILIINPVGAISYWNPAAENMFGYTAAEAIGSDLHALLAPPRYREEAEQGFDQFRTTGKGPFIGKTLELSALRRNGEEFPIEMSISSLRIDGHWHALGMIRDISERKRAEEQIRRLAYYDTLTELPNRRLLLDRLNQALAQARRHHWSLAVMFLDLDRFKVINDTLGHDAGDELLQQVAGRLTTCVRSGDTVSRQGGDEFVIILSEIAQPCDATLVAEKIIDLLQQPMTIAGQEVRITISIGIAIHPVDGTDNAQELMKKADQAMYAAKEAGRNDYRFFTQ